MNLKEPETTKNPTSGLTYLHIDLYKVSPEYDYLKINKIKSSNPENLFYYFDLVHYLKKNQNTTITKEKPQSKTIYQNILNHRSKGHITFKKQCGKQFFNLNFTKLWTNTSSSYYLPYHTDLHYQELHFAIKTKQYTDNCSHNKTNLLPSYKTNKIKS